MRAEACPMLTRLILLLAAVVAVTRAHAADLPSFTLEEPIGRNWTNEVFSFSTKPLGTLPEGTAVIDETGKSVPFEINNYSQGSLIGVLTDLPANGRHTFTLTSNGPPPTKGDVTVEETSETITLQNPYAGIRLWKEPPHGQGPIAALKLSNGSWLPVVQTLSSGEFTRAIVVHTSRTLLTRTVSLDVTLGGGVEWKLSFSLQTGDNAIVVEEHWPGWYHVAYDLGMDMRSDTLDVYYRNGKAGDVALTKLGAEPKAFELEPWLQWWLAERRGTWVAAFVDGSPTLPDALVVSAIRAGAWLSDNEAAEDRRVEPIVLSFENHTLHAAFPGRGTQRQWLLAALPQSAAIDKSLIGKKIAPPPQQLRIKHSDVNLEAMSSWINQLSSVGPRHRLMLTEDDIARIKARPITTAEVDRARRLPLNEYILGELLSYQMRTGDTEIARKISAAALPALHVALNQMLDQGDLYSLGFGPPHQRGIYYAAHLSDFALADPALPETEKLAIRRMARAILLMVIGPDYWSEVRGFAANPNMTSTVAGYRAVVACLLSDDPVSKQWLGHALEDLFDDQLLHWSDDNGGWLESPHYALAAQDSIMAALLCARAAGRNDLIAHPRIRQIAEWLAKITTPPDINHDGRRFLNPLGDTYLHEPTSWFGIMAFLMRDIDPAFSARMQWMHRASGSPQAVLVGGVAPAFEPEQTLFLDPTLSARKPDYGSELFPETGAVLRAHFGTDRETQLQIIVGRHRAHYAYDSGSIIFWGKGRLLANAWGYGPVGRDFADHSMPDIKGLSNHMKPEAFRTSQLIDEFQGIDGPWTRRVALIKDADPLGSNLILIDDSMRGRVEGNWHLWLTTAGIVSQTWGVEATGIDDVDLDVVFLDGFKDAPKEETATRRSNSSYKGPAESTQTAIVSSISESNPNRRVALIPRLKSDPKPVYSVRNDGHRLDIASQAGTDTILFGGAPFVSDGISFEGTLGLIRTRGTTHTLAISGTGRLDALGHHLDTNESKSLVWSE